MIDLFDPAILKAFKIPEPIREYKFHPTRKWRADFAWFLPKVICEIDGGAYIQGRHTRGAGFVKDMEKSNAMTELGWRLLRYTPTGVDYEQISRVIKNK